MEARDQLELKMYQSAVRRAVTQSPQEIVHNKNGWTMLSTEEYNKISKRADKNYKKELKREEKEIDEIIEKRQQEDHNNVLIAAINTQKVGKMKLRMAKMFGKKHEVISPNGLKVTVHTYKGVPYLTHQDNPSKQ